MRKDSVVGVKTSIYPNLVLLGIFGIQPRRWFVSSEAASYLHPLLPPLAWLTASLQTSTRILENFRSNLHDIDVDSATFGTHSFRRRRVQYSASERRRLLYKLRDWGGWSTDFDNNTINCYLYGLNDNPVQQREEFLNPFVRNGTYCRIYALAPFPFATIVR